VNYFILSPQKSLRPHWAQQSLSLRHAGDDFGVVGGILDVEGHGIKN